jgi:hypothetical protein
MTVVSTLILLFPFLGDRQLSPIKLELMDLSGFLVLPVSPQFEREIKFNGSGSRTIDSTASAIPAFLGMQDDGRPALLGMRDINIDLARLHADVASVTDFRIEYHRVIRC